MPDPNLELLRKMATPTRLGVTIGRDFMGYEYVPYPWLLHAERRILAAINRPGRDGLILNVPAQVSKTTTFVMLLAAWYMGFNPHNQVILVGYSEEYVGGWGLKTRNLLQRYGMELFGETVSTQQDSKTNWKMSNGFGGMLSVGIGGGITGNPGHLILIDDVIKTMEEAASTPAKDKHLTEFDGAISTRFQENTTVLITATRFAEDDLSGRLIDRQNEEGYNGDRFEVISIPAIAEAPEDLEDDEREEWRDELGRRDGEALESTHSQEFYESRKRSLPPFIWSAIYQQSPSAREGGMFPKSKWRFWDINDETRPTIVRSVRAWDLATTEGGGDYTVGAKFGLGSNGDLYLLDCERFRKNSGDVEKAVLAAARGDGFGVKILIEQERAGAGVSVVEHYKRKLAGFMVEGARADGSKEQRATPYSIMQNQERVWLPAGNKQLCDDWIDEHRKMMGDGRRGRRDDMIDVGAYATMELLGQGSTSLWIPGVDEIEGMDADALSVDRMMSVVSGRNPYF